MSNIIAHWITILMSKYLLVLKFISKDRTERHSNQSIKRRTQRLSRFRDSLAPPIVLGEFASHLNKTNKQPTRVLTRSRYHADNTALSPKTQERPWPWRLSPSLGPTTAPDLEISCFPEPKPPSRLFAPRPLVLLGKSLLFISIWICWCDREIWKSGSLSSVIYVRRWLYARLGYKVFFFSNILFEEIIKTPESLETFYVYKFWQIVQ